jgi:superfamily II DNA/RNA helicase
MKFSDLDLHPALQSAVEKLGYEEATPIQEATMPHVLEGKDVAGLAQTGTGKTAAFILPLMERIVRARLNPDQLSDEEKAKRESRMFMDWRSNQFILVLVPTRELCEQVYEAAMKFRGDSGLRAVSIYGGVSYDKQKEGLRNGVEFVIATPGRLIDLYKENLLDLKQVRAIVFDEADRMFDMGFKDDMKFILERVPKDRQFLVFSATLNLDVMNTAYQFGADPVEVNVSRDQAKAENVVDKIFHVGQEEKGPHLLSLLNVHKPRQTIVFSNFKMNVPRIAQFLTDNGHPAVGISSLMTQSQRTRVMEQFKGDSDNNILVATDVAARGLDIKGVDMVVNYELPDDPENYVHRIGRTGRAGEKGIAFSLVSDRDVDAFARVEGYLKHKIDVDYLDEAQIVKQFKAMQSDRGSRGPRPHDGGGRGAPGGGGRRDSRSGSSSSGGGGGRPERSASGGGSDRGPRRERGPRPEGASASTGGGGRPERAPRDPNAPASPGGRERGPRRGPRPEAAAAGAAVAAAGGRREQNGRGPKGEGRPAKGDHKNGAAKSGTSGKHAANGKHAHAKKGAGPSRPDASAAGKAAAAYAAKNQSISKKVGGFFKKLFGS